MAELSQEQLINTVARAINLLESDGHVCTTYEIQAYLKTIGYDEPLERIKWATDDLVAIEEEQEEQELPEWAQAESELRECPYCHQMHQADMIEQCPLKPKQGNGTISTS